MKAMWSAHLDAVLKLDLLCLERAQVVLVLAEAKLGFAQLVHVVLPVIEQADACVQFLHPKVSKRSGWLESALSSEMDARSSTARAH